MSPVQAGALTNSTVAAMKKICDEVMSKNIKNKNDIEHLQKGCNVLEKWTNLWLVSLNVDKCLAMFINKDNNENNNNYTIKGKNLIHLNSTKDLGIIVDNKLNFHDNIHEKIKKSYQMLGILKRSFKHMSVKTWTTLYKSFVRSHLEYRVCVWHPNKKYLIDELERVQRRATKMLKQCKNLSYENRLKMLNLPTLTYRRFRGDMIDI